MASRWCSTRPGPPSATTSTPNYKGNRKETPDIFVPQIPLIHEVIEALQIPTLQVPGVEADDVIATLAVRAAADGIDVIIVTGDRDSYQLVSDPHVKVLYNRRGVSDYVLYDEAGIFERTGVTPAQYPEYAALRGDPSDNLPGVPGIGEKTAAKLIATYGNLETIFEHLDDLPPKQRQNLGEARDRVFLNREMSRLRLDCDVDVDAGGAQAWARGTASRCGSCSTSSRSARCCPACSRRWVSRRPPRSRRPRSTSRSASPATTRAVLELLGTIAESDEPYAIEARWEGAPGASRLRAVAIATDDASAAYVDACAPRAARRCARRSLALFDTGGPPLIAHRAKELMHGLDADVRSLLHDTAVMAYLLDPGSGKFLLEDLALRFLSLEVRSPDAEEGTLDLDGDNELDQTGRRAVVVLQLAAALEQALEARELTELYELFELPLVRVLARMEIERHPRRPRVPRDLARGPRPSSATCTCSGSMRTRARSSTSTRPRSSARSCSRSSVWCR